MRCNHCGAENPENAKFCKACGGELQTIQPANGDTSRIYPENYANQGNGPYGNNYYEQPKKKKTGMIIGIIAGVLALILIVVGITFFTKNRNMKELEKRAIEYESQEKYALAGDEYSKLYDKTGKDKYRDKRDQMAEYEDYQRLITEAENFVRGSNYRGAISSYLKIPASAGPLYNTAKSRIDGLVDSIETELNKIIDRGDYATAAKSAEDYLRLLPDNGTLKEIKSRADEGAKRQEEERIAAKEQELEAEKQAAAAAKAEAEAAKKKAQQSQNRNTSSGSSKSKRYDLAGTWQYVQAANANVRSGPGKGYSVQYVITRGTPVYVYNTHTDSVRTWCQIGNNEWISYRTLNGEL